MHDGERLLRLVERIYEAVIEPDSWTLLLQELSETLGGAAIQLSLRLPETLPTPDCFYRVGLEDAYHPLFVKHVISGLPWGSSANQAFRGRFALASELLTEDDLTGSPFFREYMQPQGLAAEWPVCHMICAEEGRPLSGMVIYRREGCRSIDADDLRLLDLLVPHLARAYAIHCRLRDERSERRALTEVLDRLPTGVLLLDAEGLSLLQNRSLRDIVALGDGFRIRQGRPCLDDARENRNLQLLISTALEEAASGAAAGGVMSATRPSGRRSFPVMVGPLLAASSESGIHEARAIMFVADPERGNVGTSEVLEGLYQLTPAEADLVRLIAEGRSLEQVADERGVTMNTVRSQLKQVFSKTDTNRQGELVHLVLAGIASIRDGGAI
jgi:DNA-binding CsgD family transcriptional regulator